MQKRVNSVQRRRVANRFFGIRDWAYLKVGIREFKVRGERKSAILRSGIRKIII